MGLVDSMDAIFRSYQIHFESNFRAMIVESEAWIDELACKPQMNMVFDFFIQRFVH